MKKIILMTALAAVTGLMTSCSNDDDFAQSSNNATVNDNTISFSTSKSSANRRAVMSRSGVSITSLDKFYVSALNADNSVFFSMEEFNYDSSTGSFSSTTPHYWPTTGSLSFYAINEKGTHSVDANNVPKYTYSSWKGETDLVGATVIAGTKQVPYPLTFKHLLSQIYVSAEAANKTEALTYKLTSVKLNAPSTGTYSFATETGGVGTWVIDGTKATDYSYDDVLPKSFKQNGSVELSSLYWNILPTTTSSLNFTIEYQVLQNGVVICDNTGSNAKTCTIENPNLQSGKRYRYNFLLTNDSQAKITFSATITDWDEETSKDVNMPDTENNNSDIAYVDLGLPSGLKWAKMNLGATTETGYGDYFAWGETTTKSDFTSDNYSASNISSNLTLAQDAANVILGGNWRIPTDEDYNELLNTSNCSNEWILDYNGSGINGCLFTSVANGNTLFFPAGGSSYNNTLDFVGTDGYYWDSKYSSSSNAYNFTFSKYKCDTYSTPRWCGRLIRAVCQ